MGWNVGNSDLYSGEAMREWAKIVLTVLFVATLLIQIDPECDPLRRPLTRGRMLYSMIMTTILLWLIWGTRP